MGIPVPSRLRVNSSKSVISRFIAVDARPMRAAACNLPSSDTPGLDSSIPVIAMPDSGPRRSCPSTAMNMSRETSTRAE